MNGRDPYYGFWEMSRAESRGLMPLYYCIGTVLEVGEGKLRIRADGHELDEEDLYINDALRWNFEEKAEMELTGNQLEGMTGICALGSAAPGFTITGGSIAGKYKVESRLKAGDEVLLIPSSDRQTYYVVMKVVSVG